MSAPQNYKNHARLDPKFHFFVIPVLLINIGVVIWRVFNTWHLRDFLSVPNIILEFWEILVTTAIFMGAGIARDYALKSQDRVIRLEEKLRYEKVLPPELLERSAILTLRQVIALRFASDAELPNLVKRSLTEGLSGKQIKEAIQNWRADYQRV